MERLSARQKVSVGLSALALPVGLVAYDMGHPLASFLVLAVGAAPLALLLRAEATRPDWKGSVAAWALYLLPVSALAFYAMTYLVFAVGVTIFTFCFLGLAAIAWLSPETIDRLAP